MTLSTESCRRAQETTFTQPTGRALELDDDVTVRIEAGGGVALFIKEEDSNTITMYEVEKGPKQFIRLVQSNKLTHN